MWREGLVSPHPGRSSLEEEKREPCLYSSRPKVTLPPDEHTLPPLTVALILRVWKSTVIWIVGATWLDDKKKAVVGYSLLHERDKPGTTFFPFPSHFTSLLLWVQVNSTNAWFDSKKGAPYTMFTHALLNLLWILFDYNSNFSFLLPVSTVCITYVYLLLLKIEPLRHQN